ncbi:MAG: D-alanyl-D-alanine carboxypeptidase family protein [Chthoniobacterales bacterium]
MLVRLFRTFIALAILWSATGQTQAELTSVPLRSFSATNTRDNAPKVSARSALVIDARTGTILYEKNSTFHQPAASMQKLLTALVIIRDGDLSRTVTIQETDTLCEPSKVYLQAGETYTRMALLEALLVHSGNDCARALARDNAGSLPAFAVKMNQLARELGAVNSHFLNPNGLPAEGQYSCARDIAIIARTAYSNPVVRRITSMKTLDFRRPGRGIVTYRNTNKLLVTYPLCNGLKTGYTELAGFCLASSGRSALRDSIVVVMHCTKAGVWSDSYRLLSWSLGI